MVVAAASRPAPPEDLPAGLVEQICEGKVLRADRIAECRRRLLEGPAPDARAIVDAMLREVARDSHPALAGRG